MARGTTSTRCRLILKSLRSKLILVAAKTTQSLARIDHSQLAKHSTKKSGKCPKTLREDGSRNLPGCNMESQTRRKGVVTLNDVDELDAIIEESRKISALTKITECISPCT